MGFIGETIDTLRRMDKREVWQRHRRAAAPPAAARAMLPVLATDRGTGAASHRTPPPPPPPAAAAARRSANRKIADRRLLRLRAPPHAAAHQARVVPFFARLPQFFQQVINLGMILSSALVIWKTLILVTRSESPVVVVLRRVASYLRALLPCARAIAAAAHAHIAGRQLARTARPGCSGSMEPAFQRGDILFLNNWVRTASAHALGPAARAP